jgi:hypothetical protein
MNAQLVERVGQKRSGEITEDLLNSCGALKNS